jgi:hypothetical protein
LSDSSGKSFFWVKSHPLLSDAPFISAGDAIMFNHGLRVVLAVTFAVGCLKKRPEETSPRSIAAPQIEVPESAADELGVPAGRGEEF